MSINNCTFSLANLLGPLLGGIFIDYLSWRWMFYINIPVVLVAVLVIIFLLPLEKPSGSIYSQIKQVDYLGTITLVSGTILFVLGMNWGGKEYQWVSSPVLVCLIIGFIILILFGYVQTRVAKEPIIPSHIFNRNVILSSLCSLCLGFLFFVFIYHWPLYYQNVKHSSATQAGIELLPVVLGVCGFAAISGFIVTYTKSYRLLMILGMCLLVVGNSLMARLGEMNRAEQILYPLILGIGIGLNIQSATISAQAASKECDVAIVSAFVNFALNIGGVLGLAIYGAILNNYAGYLLKDTLPGIDIVSLISRGGDVTISNSLIAAAFEQAYRVMFVALLPISVIGLFCVLGLLNIPLVHEVKHYH